MQARITRKHIWLIVGGGVCLLGILILLVDLEEILALLRGINWIEILTASIVLVFGYLFLTIRLRYILLNQTGWWDTFYANSIGYFIHIALFIPALVGRTVCVGWITSVTVAQASSALVVERLLDMIMRVLVIVLALTVFATGQEPLKSVSGSLVMLLIVFGLLFWLLNHREAVVNRLVPWVTGFRGISETQVRSTTLSVLHGLDAIGSARRLIVSLLLSGVAWAAFFGFQFLVITALPVPFSTNQRLAIATAVLAIMPPSVNVMLIVYQVVVIVSLVAFQLTDATTATAYSIALYLIMLICWAILGGWSYTQTDLRFSQLVDEVKQYTGRGSPVTEDAV